MRGSRPRDPRAGGATSSRVRTRRPTRRCPATRTCSVRSPVTVGHHLLAWVEMLERDLERFRLAAGAAHPPRSAPEPLAGSTLPLPPTARSAPELASTRSATATSPSTTSTRARSCTGTSRVSARSCASGQRGVRLRPSARVGRHRLVDAASEAEPGRGGARAREGRHGDRTPDRPACGDERTPARVQPRPPGRQGAGVRRSPRCCSHRGGTGRARPRARRSTPSSWRSLRRLHLLATTPPSGSSRTACRFGTPTSRSRPTCSTGPSSRQTRRRHRSLPVRGNVPRAIAEARTRLET